VDRTFSEKIPLDLPKSALDCDWPCGGFDSFGGDSRASGLEAVIMVHGYHVIWGTYGFWLPNDPRGSWSGLVYAWELAKFGRVIKHSDRVDLEPRQYAMWRAAARQKLQYPAVTLTGLQARAVAEGFGRFAAKSGLSIWSCSIMPEHVHLVLARHRYNVEQAVHLLKGEATRRLVEERLHPMEAFRAADGRLPSVWAEGCWKVFLDTEQAIEDAIHYVEQNPVRESKAVQHWSFVTPFAGIDRGGWTTYR
jgi:REP element-mobilizing transposase RayT